MEDCNCIYDWGGRGQILTFGSMIGGGGVAQIHKCGSIFTVEGGAGDRRYMPLGVLFIPGGGEILTFGSSCISNTFHTRGTSLGPPQWGGGIFLDGRINPIPYSPDTDLHSIYTFQTFYTRGEGRGGKARY